MFLVTLVVNVWLMTCFTWNDVINIIFSSHIQLNTCTIGVSVVTFIKITFVKCVFFKLFVVYNKENIALINYSRSMYKYLSYRIRSSTYRWIRQNTNHSTYTYFWKNWPAWYLVYILCFHVVIICTFLWPYLYYIHMIGRN